MLGYIVVTFLQALNILMENKNKDYLIAVKELQKLIKIMLVFDWKILIFKIFIHKWM